MLKSIFALAIIVGFSSSALADLTLYKGSPNSSQVLGTFATKKELRAWRSENVKGYGYSVVNNTTGRVYNSPGKNRPGNRHDN